MRPRKRPPMLCSHANECPNVCECDEGCYCYPGCQRVGRHAPGRPRPRVRQTIRVGRFDAEVYPGGVFTIGDSDERLGLAANELPALRRLVAKMEAMTAGRRPPGGGRE